MNSRTIVESLSASELLSATQELVRKSRGFEVELLVHLGEIDERRLYLDRAFSSMFAFCVGELGFSAPAPHPRRRPGDDLRKGTRLADRTGQEGAVRHGSEGATSPERRRGRVAFASHPRRHQARGLRARRWPLHVRRRAWPQVRRNWRPGIRSPGRVRANASPPSGPDPPALPCAQSARRGADVRSRVHATSARIARPRSNSSGDSFRDLTRCGPRRGGLNPDPEMLEVIHGGSRSKSGSESWST